MADILNVRGLRLVPLAPIHIREILVTKEMIKDARLLGYDSTQEMFEYMLIETESYAVLDDSDTVIVITGLFHQDGADSPQMYAMFSAHAKGKGKSLFRASRALVDHFHRWHPVLRMIISSQFPFMLQWATWLGFEPVMHDAEGFIHFVRCNDEQVAFQAEHRPTKH